MLNHVVKILLIVFTVVSFSANARMIGNQELPESIFTHIGKKHPKAQDFSVSEKTHFGQPLYEITFKERIYDDNNEYHEEEFVQLYRLDGHFYASVLSLEPSSYDIFSSTVTKSLKSNYPGYEILSMKSVANPNGAGEEYEIDLRLSGETLNISMDNQGTVISESTQDINALPY